MENLLISFLFKNYSLKPEDDLLPKIGSKETSSYTADTSGHKKTWMPPYFGLEK